MPFTIWDNLQQDFNAHNGALISYIDKTGAGITPRYHYDLRAFHSDDLTVPQTMLDMNYWNAMHFNGTQMVVLDNDRIVSGRSVAARNIGSLSSLTLEELNTLDMGDLDLATLTAGNENWPVGDANVVYGKDSTERYATSMRITLTSGVEKIVGSSFRDNIIADLDDAGHDYFIEFALPSFPAQAAGTHLDLNASTVEFSSDPAYPVGGTDVFRFNDSLNSLVAGGDTYFRINRDSIVNADRSNITNIRFRLKSVGGMTLKIQAMRVVRDDYTWDTIDTESKREVLARSVPRNSGTEPTTVTSGANGPILNLGTNPKNVNLVARFNSGHNPVGNDNILRLYARYDVENDDAIFVEFKARSTQSTMTLYQRIAGVNTQLTTTSTLTGILTEEKDYVLSLVVNEEQAQAYLYSAAGAFLGGLYYSTLPVEVTLIDNGRTGFYFFPYNYDFTISYMQNHRPDFAHYESTPFNSITPVIGASLTVQTSPSYDLAIDSFVESGDAVVTNDPNFGLAAPAKKFVRDGTSWQGGYQTSDYIYIGNTKYLTIEGDIWPIITPGQTGLRGEWRVVLLDQYDSVGYIGKIRGLLPSQWNHFRIHINNENITPAAYRVIIQQIGFYNDEFWIDNLQVNHQTVTWELSPNGGTDWYRFLVAQNQQYASLNFKDNPGTQVKIRALGLSDLSWIAGYLLEPIYALPGQYNPAPPAAPADSATDRNARITGTGTVTFRAQDVRITGTGASSNTTRDVRITGMAAPTSSVTRDVRVTGTANSNTTRDARIIGYALSNTTRDVRITGVAPISGLSLPLLFNH